MGEYNTTRQHMISIKILKIRSGLQFFESLAKGVWVNVSGYCGDLNRHDPLYTQVFEFLDHREHPC